MFSNILFLFRSYEYSLSACHHCVGMQVYSTHDAFSSPMRFYSLEVLQLQTVLQGPLPFGVRSRFRSWRISQLRQWRQWQVFGLNNLGSISCKDRNLSVYLPSQSCPGFSPVTTYWVPRALFGLKGPGRQPDHLPPSGIEDYNTEHRLYQYIGLNTNGYISGPPIFLFPGYCGSFPGVKQQGCDVDLFPPYNSKVKNERRYVSVPSICLQGVDRDNFTFL